MSDVLRSTPKKTRLQIYLTPTEIVLIESTARSLGLSRSEFARRRLLGYAITTPKIPALNLEGYRLLSAIAYSLAEQKANSDSVTDSSLLNRIEANLTLLTQHLLGLVEPESEPPVTPCRNHDCEHYQRS